MTESTDEPADESPRDREDVLALLDDGLREAHRKACVSTRVYDAENEKVRQGWLRVLGYLAGQYRQLKRDVEIDDLAERLEELERRYGDVPPGPVRSSEPVSADGEEP